MPISCSGFISVHMLPERVWNEIAIRHYCTSIRRPENFTEFVIYVFRGFPYFGCSSAEGEERNCSDRRPCHLPWPQLETPVALVSDLVCWHPAALLWRHWPLHTLLTSQNKIIWSSWRHCPLCAVKRTGRVLIMISKFDWKLNRSSLYMMYEIKSMPSALSDPI